MTGSAWRIRRRLLGYRQRDVADRANISQSRYSLLERSEALPSAEESAAIDRTLQLSEELQEEVRQVATCKDSQCSKLVETETREADER
jgi:transcriptional regulator with XRE-family HTH domain